jgi:hypothetical protein
VVAAVVPGRGTGVRRKPRWWATEKGKKYHGANWCFKVLDNDSTLVPVTEKEIRRRHLTPCAECKPTPPLRSVE